MDAGPAVGVDVGGTFTDVLLLANGSLTTVKTPTTDHPTDGVLEGIMQACDQAEIDPGGIDRFRHATTTAVNAVLEGTGAKTALVTTSGFRDVLAIRRQERPALYDLDATPPAPLVPESRRYSIDERTTTEGVERAVDEAAVDDLAEDIEAEAVAVCLLHAYAHPGNEQRVVDTLRTQLDVPVSASHEVLATFREYERTATTVADAYVAPRISAYLDRLTDRATARDLPIPRVMQSNGGIASADTVRDRPVATILSGPAAGVIGAQAAGAAVTAGEDSPTEGSSTDLVTFDMGGTSTDVSVIHNGAVAQTTEADVAGHPVRVPMVDVNTIGAGGGSIAWVDAGGALRVGPRSAGADPGPACYGLGGDEPTATDAVVSLGYLGDGTALGTADGVRLDGSRATEVLTALADEAGLDGPEAAAAGIYRVATARMARAVRSVTTERGQDVRTLTLVAFGGAGPMFAAALAARLGIDRVVVPRTCGILSAFGLLAADERHDAVRTRRTRLAEAEPATIDESYDSLTAQVRDDMTAPAEATVNRGAACRYAGQGYELSVPVEQPFDPGAVASAFHEAHERVYGYRLDDPVELVTLRITATRPGSVPPVAHTGTSLSTARTGTRAVRYPERDVDGSVQDTSVFRWADLPADERISGPAILEGGESTVVVPPSWTVALEEGGTAVLAPPESAGTPHTGEGS